MGHAHKLYRVSIWFSETTKRASGQSAHTFTIPAPSPISAARKGIEWARKFCPPHYTAQYHQLRHATIDVDAYHQEGRIVSAPKYIVTVDQQCNPIDKFRRLP